MYGCDCLICRHSLKTVEGIKSHVGDKHKDEINDIVDTNIRQNFYVKKDNSCSLCNYRFTNADESKIHMIINHPNYIRDHTITNNIFISIESTHGFFICPKCDLTIYGSIDTFNRHKTMCIPQPKQIMEQLDDSEDEQSWKESTDEPPDFICPTCEHSFKSKGGLTRHLNRKKPCVKPNVDGNDGAGSSKMIESIESETDDDDDTTAEYVYLLQESAYINGNDPVYKIGRTSQKFGKRFAQYPKNSVVFITMKVNNSKTIERKLMEKFRKDCGWRKDIGNEYFSIRDINLAIKSFFETCFYQ